MKKMGKGKIIGISICCFLILVIIACGIIFYQVPIDFDLSKITTIQTDVQLLAADNSLNHSGTKALAKVKDGAISEEDFKVMFFTDTHVCELKESTAKTVERIVARIEAEKPDLVIFGGDTLNGLNDRVRVYNFANIMDKLGVYWAPVLGNHEGDRSFLMTSRKQVVNIWSKYGKCLIEPDVKKTADGTIVEGYGNYFVNILGQDGYIDNSFVMLDNGGKLMKKADYEKWGVSKKSDVAISTAQVTWYNETYTAIKSANGKDFNHFCVIHKPLQEYANAVTINLNDRKYGEELEWSFTQEAQNSGWTHVDGTFRDKVHCPPYVDGDLYGALVANGAKAVFFGHDHVNDATLYDSANDIYMTYIRLGTVTEHIAEAEGYNIMNIATDNGNYEYIAYNFDGSQDVKLFGNK